MKRFQGKVILITGASSGIGAALARQFAREGGTVVLAARRLEKLREVEAECRALSGEAFSVVADVTREGDLEKAVSEIQGRYGKLDVVVANAGFGVAGRLDSLRLEDYRRQFETNVFGLLRTIYSSLEELKKSRGNLVLIGSVAGHIALPESSAYSASKFAVRAIAEALRFELLSQGVRVTLISPGFVASEFRQIDNQGQHHEAAGEPIPSWILVPAESAAREIVSAVHRGQAERIVTGHGKVFVFIRRMFPWMIDLVKSRGLKSRPEPKT